MKIFPSNRKLLSCLSIRAKIQMLIIASILFLSLMSFVGTGMIIQRYNTTLYQSIETSLSYATREISGYLDTVNSLADQILANNVIQSTLADWKKNDNSIASSAAYTSIYQQINNYLMGSDRQYISYMVMKQGSKTVSSSYLVALKVPSQVLNSLVTAAEEADGSTRIVSDYCESFGLFAVREIKESKNLSFQNLGSVIINIDMNELLNRALENKMEGAVSYMLLENDRLLLADGALDQTDAKELLRSPENSYRLYPKDNETFFIVRAEIPSYGFDIIYAISYSRIYAAISEASFLACSFLIAGVILVLLISTAVTSLMTNNFKLLVHNMQLFADGKYTLTDREQELSARTDEVGMLYKGFNDMAVRIDALIEKNYVNELLQKEAQLKALESQMDPHFLYNTLDSINWRAKAIHADDISQICTSLGALLRITLRQDIGPFTLGEEMQLVTNYIKIQHMRYPNKLIYRCDISEALYPVSLPKFTIQPLVENAIRYSLMNAVNKCEITVNAFLIPDESSGHRILTIRVKNNGSCFEEDLLQKLENGERQPHGFGIGLLNVHKRLRIAYGEPYGLQVYNEDGEFEDYAIAEVRIPAKEAF